MARLSHRGPDGKNILQIKHAAMGHWHFWTTPEEVGEKQPLQISNLPFVIVFDGRLDNREELYNKLGINLEESKNLSDAALTLHAYQRWEKDCVRHFIGEFALVIIDVHKKQLFCARDQLGERTLFYTLQSSRKIIIASEPWAIAGAFDAIPSINENYVAHYFAFKSTKDGQSFFNGINELLPAHALLINTTENKTWRYWHPDQIKKIRYKSDGEYGEHFLSLLEISVRSRLRSTTPVGVFMSGGLDSTSVACLAARMLKPEPLTTISYVYDELNDCDERCYINAIKEKYPIRSIEILGDDAWAFRGEYNRPRNLNLPDENFFRFLNEKGYSFAQQNDLRVLLNGEGGDHLFSAGVYWLTDLLSEGQVMKAFRELSNTRYLGFRKFLKSGVLQCVIRQILNSLPGGKYLHRKQSVPSWLSPLSQEYILKQRTRLVDPLSRYANVLGMSSSRRLSSEKFYSRCHGIELRYPFHDRRLVEFLFGLPAYQLFAHGLSKHILRTAMKDVLPDIVRLRSGKTGLSALLFRGVERENKLLQTHVQDVNAVWRKHISPEWLKLYGDYSHTPDTMERETLVPWLCGSYAMWHKKIS